MHVVCSFQGEIYGAQTETKKKLLKRSLSLVICRLWIATEWRSRHTLEN